MSLIKYHANLFMLNSAKMTNFSVLINKDNSVFKIYLLLITILPLFISKIFLIINTKKITKRKKKKNKKK